MNNVLLGVSTLPLLTISFVSKLIATIVKFPGNKIDTFIRWSAIKHIKIIGLKETMLRLISPMVSIRYFEFGYVLRQLSGLENISILDISSPKYMGLYLSSKYPNIKYMMVNPDAQDIKDTNKLVHEYRLNNISTRKVSALSLPYDDESFDYVISISVIEHIDLLGDTVAIKEMYRVLKPGGKIILTTHIARKGWDEYRNIDQYGLGVHKRNSKYFYQRIYDLQSFESRILSAVSANPLNVEIWGEKKVEWFNQYTQKRIVNGYRETSKDLWHMMTKFKKYNKANDLPGIGVIGVVIKKNR